MTESTILIAGVAVVDFIFKVEEMPRRSEKYHAIDSTIIGGGCAANAAVAVARLGGSALLASRVGDDRIGEMIVGDLRAEGVNCDLVKTFAGMRSQYSSVFVDAAGERQIVSYRDSHVPLDAEWLEAAMPDRFQAALADTRWPRGAAAVLAAAKAMSRPGVIDAEAPVAESAEALDLASHIAFSAQGLRDYTGQETLSKALHAAAEKSNAWICYTNGAKGVTFLHEGEERTLPAPQVDVIDTLGAGDTWHGAFTLALAEGENEVDAITFANAVASLKCTRFGGRAGIPTREEVSAFMAGR